MFALLLHLAPLFAPFTGTATPLPLAEGADELATLVNSFPLADPCAAAVSTDETLAFVAEGASITFLDLTQPTPVALRRASIDATVMQLNQVGTRLFVCGGSQGLFAFELGDLDAGPRAIDDLGDAVCTDAVQIGSSLAVSYALAEGSQLRTYDLASLALQKVVPLPAGRAYALATDGKSVWVAMGVGGLVRVDLDAAPRPRVLPGPRGQAAFPAPDGFKLEPGLVRDIAILGRTLFCAADAAGLASLSLDAAWREGMPLQVTPLTVRGAPAYAVRVDAAHGRLAVGLGRAPVRQLEGAPYNPNGIVGVNLTVGGVKRSLAPLGRSEALLVFDLNTEEAQKRLFELPPDCGWLSLALGRERVYEQHLGIGFLIRDLTGEAAGETLFERRPRGFPAIDGIVSTTDPGLILFGTDPAGSRPLDALRVTSDGRLRAEATSAGSLGLIVGAAWKDKREEWFVSGAAEGWNLWRVEPATEHETPRVSGWTLQPPLDKDRVRGHTYFNSAIDGDLLLLTRYGSAEGGLVCSAKALVELAREHPVGAVLDMPGAHALTTQTGGKRRSTWRSDFATLASGRRIAVIAAGFDGDSESPTHKRSRLCIYNVSDGAGTAPVPLAALHGPDIGHAVAVQLARYDERVLAFVADLAAGLLVFDVTRPKQGRVIGRWAAPVSAFDGAAANVLDLELARVDGKRVAFLAAGRTGLVCVDVTEPDSMSLPTLAVWDTPGLASGLTKARIGGRRMLVVGDQRSGLRVYALGETRTR